MLVQVGVIFLFVAVMDFVVIPGDLHQLAHHAGELPQGDPLHVDVRQHLGFTARLTHRQPDLRRVKGAVTLRERVHGIFAGAHDVPFLHLGGVGIVGQRIFQPPELLSRITAKGVDRPPG